jgi:hypothetical protein
MLLGTSTTMFKYHKTIPSVLEHFETSMRDPVFYQLYKRIIYHYWSFENHLPPYTRTDLFFVGVKIESVVVDKLVTFFDIFYSDITNVIDIEKFDDTYKETDLKTFGRKTHYMGNDVVIKAKQYRLNHKPFNVHLNVFSEKPQKAAVKMFLGPKYDQYGSEYTLNKNRENFMQLDYFVVELASGMNAIDRSCQQFSDYVTDYTTYYDLYKDVMTSTKSKTDFYYDKYEHHSGFPWRLMLPKGTKGGMVFKMFFMVMPFTDSMTVKDTLSTTYDNHDEYDYRSYGFPLDRKINELYWYTPNMYYYDVTIYHEEDVKSMMF